MSDPFASLSTCTKAPLFERLILTALHVALFLLAETITWNWTHSLSALQHRGVQASAIIVNKGMTTGRGEHPFISYRYTTDYGMLSWTRTESVLTTDYNEAKIGETAPVVFDPQSPARARLIWHGEGPGGNYLLAFFLLTFVWFMIAAFGLVMIWMGADSTAA